MEMLIRTNSWPLAILANNLFIEKHSFSNQKPATLFCHVHFSL